jgi:hypothetical protein
MRDPLKTGFNDRIAAAAEARRLAEIEARAAVAETELEAKRRERKERKAAAKEEARLKKEMKRAH